ncbi:MAG: hypothetical protein HFI10_12720, partial [Lachnospiraceae bacterium]|nr:hypothetical protein [Lachnospiraceae bacterium]
MSESYVECLIKHKTPTVKVFLRILFTVLTVLFALLIFMAGFLALIMAVVCGVLSYFMTLEPRGADVILGRFLAPEAWIYFGVWFFFTNFVCK